LTQNKMTTQQIYADENLIDGEDMSFTNPVYYQLMKAAVLANDASTSADGAFLGDPTEVALVNLGHSFSVFETEYRAQHPRLGELAFDSDRKLMSALFDTDGAPTMFTKGAMDELLARSSSIITSDGVRPLTEADRTRMVEVNNRLSQQGLRVLAFAYRTIDSVRPLVLEDEAHFTFIGLISMIDPPREESRKAVADAKLGGIRT
ncbi:MAG: ATPase, partial [Oscillospiraceae bacterium]